jgi:FkbM family methyltransferase
MIIAPLPEQHLTLAKLASTGHLRVHFSQFGEDAVLWTYLQAKKDGFYVDVGCHHPLKYSNTALLHIFNKWNGINIDVDQRSIDQFERLRPADVNICTAVGRQAGTLEVTIFEDGAINTFDKKMAEDPRWESMPRQKKMVNVQPLHSLLNLHLPPDRKIDLLNVDIEGLDLDALQSNDWDKFRPHYISVEVHRFNLNEPTTSQTFNYLRSNGYALVSHAFATSLYVDTKHANR